ncbi:MAG: hypothetical protein ACKN9V_07915 [Pseudomonadota bacterium]
MEKYIRFLLTVTFCFTSFSEPIHKQSQVLRAQEPNRFATFQTCKDTIEDTVSKLNCKIPPVVYGPGLSLKKSMEYFVQFYAARNGVNYDQLNTLANLTQTPEGKKALVYYFTGLKCAGLPGDPINRKNWKTYVPDCPAVAPKSPPWVKDNKWGTANYHPGAYKCLRLGASRPEDCPLQETLWQCIGKEWFQDLDPKLAQILIDKIPSQQCCYDSESNLITEGPSAGTPDTVFRSHSVEEAAEKHFLKLEEQGRTLKIEDVEKELEKNKRSVGEIKESLAHHIMDARIIDACFPDWPGKNNQSVKTYHALGWTPFK